MPFINSRLLRITFASVVTGVLIGAVGGAFQLLLKLGDVLRNHVFDWAHSLPHAGWLIPVAIVAAGAAIARLMVVRIAPEAAGSGLQRVEAVFDKQAEPAGFAVLPVKFVGGVLAIGSGLALGREGPTAQMGSSLANLVSCFLIKDKDDARVIEASGAGAGIAVAFNAPIGGAILVFEELTESFTSWLLVSALAACLMAVWMMRLMLGNSFDFKVPQVTLHHIAPGLVLGILLGALGACYNWLIVLLLRLSDRIRGFDSVLRAAFIGAVLGLLGWFAPSLIGGGDNLTQAALSGNVALRAIAVIFCVRFFVGPWSYSAGTPGGLFAPMLVVGASFGALFGSVVRYLYPVVDISIVACAVIGMATLFAACVRAPLTGIMLTVEMTGRGDLTLGMLAGAMAAIVITILMGSEPIYTTLKRQMLEKQALAEKAATSSVGASG